MNSKRQKGHDEEGPKKNMQLSHSFRSHKKDKTSDNLVYINDKRQQKEKSMEKGLYDSILYKFLNHSKQLDW